MYCPGISCWLFWKDRSWNHNLNAKQKYFLMVSDFLNIYFMDRLKINGENKKVSLLLGICFSSFYTTCIKICFDVIRSNFRIVNIRSVLLKCLKCISKDHANSCIQKYLFLKYINLSLIFHAFELKCFMFHSLEL